MGRIEMIGVRVMLLALVVAQSATEAMAQSWKDRLQSEGPVAWAKLEDFYSHLECSWIERSEATAGKLKGHTVERQKTLLIDGVLRRMHSTRPSTGRQGVMAVNSRYVFHIQRDAEEKPYHVVRYYRKKDAASFLQDLDLELAELVPCPYSFFARPLREWVTHPNLVTDEVVPAPEGPPGLLRWKARFRPGRPGPKESPPFTLGFTVTLLLDSNQSWCVQKYEALVTYENGHQVRFVGALDYGSSIDDFPVISRVTTTVTNLTDGRAQVRTAVMQSFARKTDVPEKEFTLTAFGVAELEEWPDDWPADRGYLWYWILGGAGAAGAVALWFRVRARKRAGVTSP